MSGRNLFFCKVTRGNFSVWLEKIIHYRAEKRSVTLSWYLGIFRREDGEMGGFER